MKTNAVGTYTTTDVYCDMITDGGGWIMIQRNRNNSRFSFNLFWKNYKDGFGDLNDDFLAGLDAYLDTNWSMGVEDGHSKGRQYLDLSSLQSLHYR